MELYGIVGLHFFECREKKGGREVGLMGDNYYGMGFSKGYLWNEGRVLVFANLGFGYLRVDWEISHC